MVIGPYRGRRATHVLPAGVTDETAEVGRSASDHRPFRRRVCMIHVTRVVRGIGPNAAFERGVAGEGCDERREIEVAV